jgi:hypothetical protein
MMENHGYNQLINNPNALFIDQYAKSANLADQLFRHRPPQFDQLPGSGRPFKLWRAN